MATARTLSGHFRSMRCHRRWFPLGPTLVPPWPDDRSIICPRLFSGPMFSTNASLPCELSSDGIDEASRRIDEASNAEDATPLW